MGQFLTTFQKYMKLLLFCGIINTTQKPGHTPPPAFLEGKRTTTSTT